MLLSEVIIAFFDQQYSDGPLPVTRQIILIKNLDLPKSKFQLGFSKNKKIKMMINLYMQ